MIPISESLDKLGIGPIRRVDHAALALAIAAGQHPLFQAPPARGYQVPHRITPKHAASRKKAKLAKAAKKKQRKSK